MNKYYIALALLVSTCTASVIKSVEEKKSTETPQASAQECTRLKAGYAEPCACSDVGKVGTCAAGAFKADKKTRQYYCKCVPQATEKKQTRSSNDQPNNDMLSEKRNSGRIRIELGEGSSSSNNVKLVTSTNRGIFVFSQDIDAPIYNLSMQRALVPLSYGVMCDCPWFFSVAPYGKTKQDQEIKADDVHLSNVEGGALVQAGYYGSWWFANCIADLGGTKTDANIGENYTASSFRFGFGDALFGLGLKTNNCDSEWAAHGQWFFGVSTNRLGGHADKTLMQDKVFDVGNLGTGIQADVDWTFATFQDCKFEFSALSRFTYFLKKHLAIEKEIISYTPGSYVDVLLGLTQYYGSDYRHQIEIGYNPTVRVIAASAVGEHEESDDNNNDSVASVARLNEPEAGKTRHSIYALYSYNWNIDSMPMIISIGGSATITPHTNTYGTVFGTFGLVF